MAHAAVGEGGREGGGEGGGEVVGLADGEGGVEVDEGGGVGFVPDPVVPGRHESAELFLGAGRPARRTLIKCGGRGFPGVTGGHAGGSLRLVSRMVATVSRPMAQTPTTQ